MKNYMHVAMLHEDDDRHDHKAHKGSLDTCHWRDLFQFKENISVFSGLALLKLLISTNALFAQVQSLS